MHHPDMLIMQLIQSLHLHRRAIWEFHFKVETNKNMPHYQRVLFQKGFGLIFADLSHVTNLVKYNNDADIVYVQIFLLQDLINLV